jgi:hypothetical protein
MPYILPERRPELDVIIEQFPGLDDGQLNYVFTLLAHKCVQERGLRYVNLNALVGVFDCAKMEFYRRVVVPYEKRKIAENGGVSRIDKELNNEA